MESRDAVTRLRADGVEDTARVDRAAVVANGEGIDIAVRIRVPVGGSTRQWIDRGDVVAEFSADAGEGAPSVHRARRVQREGVNEGVRARIPGRGQPGGRVEDRK